MFTEGDHLEDKFPNIGLPDDKPKFEVKGTNKRLMYVTPSIHTNGHPYEIIGTKMHATLNPLQRKEFQEHLYNICRKHNLDNYPKIRYNSNNEKKQQQQSSNRETLTDEQIKKSVEILAPFYVKDSRDLFVFHFSGMACKYNIDYDSTVKILSDIIEKAGYDDENNSKTIQVVRDTYKNFDVRGPEKISGYVGLLDLIVVDDSDDDNSNNNPQQQILDSVLEIWKGSTINGSNSSMCDRKSRIFQSFEDVIKNGLSGNVWTMISESPPKFIVAMSDKKYICRMAVSYVNSEQQNGKTIKICHLNTGAIIIRAIPTKITKHESPLKFLESPITYTIEFENIKNHKFTLSGTIEDIYSQLAKRGSIVSSFGSKEALNAVIEGWDDDNQIEIDNSVDFEGFYYFDGDIRISKIDFNKKHPIRTKDECITCAEYLDKRSKFQVWNYKGQRIDRTDLLATAIEWTISAPFNFALKQLTRKSTWCLKGFDLMGERDGGKSGISQEMLNIHGNHTTTSSTSSEEDNNDDEMMIYSVAAGSANTEAKFGRAISRTTYPIEITEFGTIENYGRNEPLITTLKTAVDGLKVREGRGGGTNGRRYDMPFPSLSPLIINGNQFISRRSEIIKRLHVSKFSEEDRHEKNDPKTIEFNNFQDHDGHLIKILGDWTMRYIYENRKELLLCKKYTIYEIGNIALKAFYEFIGRDIPSWLKLWITDTALEEIDTDEESIIRSILYDHIHKVLNNSRFVDLQNLETTTNNYGTEYKTGRVLSTTLEFRISKVLDNDLCSWIRRTQDKDKYYIDSSILELFRFRLPDLSLKKVGAKMRIYKYSCDVSGRRVLVCSKTELIDFIIGRESGTHQTPLLPTTPVE